jgi:hypothetical protein
MAKKRFATIGAEHIVCNQYSPECPRLKGTICKAIRPGAMGRYRRNCLSPEKAAEEYPSVRDSLEIGGFLPKSR